MSSDGSKLYIANEDDNLVTVCDVDTREKLIEIPVSIEPEGIGLSLDGSLLVGTPETTNMADFIDTETLEIIDNVVVDARPRMAQFTTDDSAVWVPSEIDGTVAVISAVTREVKTTISFEIASLRSESIQPVGIAIADDGSDLVYVTLGLSARVAVVNATTYEIEDYLLVGSRVWNISFLPDRIRLLTTNGVSGDVSVKDVEKRRVIKSVKVDRFPSGVVVGP